MKTKPLFLILVFAFFANFAMPASAITPQGRKITGTITKVDAVAREVEMVREDSGEPVMFTWNKHTSFLADGQFVDSTVLKKGARIEAIRHAPFFGKPFATKITLLTNNHTKTKTK